MEQSKSILNNSQCGFTAIYVAWLLLQIKTCLSHSPKSNFRAADYEHRGVNTRQHLTQCVFVTKLGTCLLSYHPN